MFPSFVSIHITIESSADNVSRPVRDDRNRSVTFLKRKGGLFKKAHELSVLCSVDVAVVIFGHNKKLYEYSSSDINEIVGRFQYVRDKLSGSARSA